MCMLFLKTNKMYLLFIPILINGSLSYFLISISMTRTATILTTSQTPSKKRLKYLKLLIEVHYLLTKVKKRFILRGSLVKHLYFHQSKKHFFKSLIVINKDYLPHFLISALLINLERINNANNCSINWGFLFFRYFLCC